jgi:hypothetical protein
MQIFMVEAGALVSGGRDQENCSRLAWANNSGNPVSKIPNT